MVSKKIPHPLRTIKLNYDELKPFQPFEEEMLERYTKLHNFVKDLFEEYHDIQEMYELHDRKRIKLESQLKTLSIQLTRVEAEMRHVGRVVLPGDREAEMMIALGKEFEKRLEQFHLAVQDIADESRLFYTFFSKLEKKDENLSEIFEEYKSFRTELYNNGANYSIDSAQYDIDEQDFCCALDDMNARQDEFVEVCNVVIDKFNVLIEKIERLYNRWEGFNRRIDKLNCAFTTRIDYRKMELN